MITPVQSQISELRPNLLSDRLSENARKKPAQKLQTDQYQPSELAQSWSRSGLSPDSSIHITEEKQLDFTLNYTVSREEQLSASGYYSKESQTLDVNLQYRFQRKVIIDGKEQLKSFELNLSIHADRSKESSVEPYSEKEDIIGFIRRLANDLIDTAADKKQKLIGVILDKKDVAEILGLEKGRIAKLIFSLISSVLMLEEIRHAGDKEDEVENVMLRAVRQESSGLKLEHSKNTSFSMSLSIREISGEAEDANASSQEPATDSVAEPETVKTVDKSV